MNTLSNDPDAPLFFFSWAMILVSIFLAGARYNQWRYEPRKQVIPIEPESISLPTDLVPPIEMHHFLQPDTGSIPVILDTVNYHELPEPITSPIIQVLPLHEVVNKLSAEVTELKADLEEEKAELAKVVRTKNRHWNTIKKLRSGQKWLSISSY